MSLSIITVPTRNMSTISNKKTSQCCICRMYLCSLRRTGVQICYNIFSKSLPFVLLCVIIIMYKYNYQRGIQYGSAYQTFKEQCKDQQF